MNLTLYSSLTWAFQLHYYLCFRTSRRRPIFSAQFTELEALLQEICTNHDYHLLERQPYPDQLRCLISLRPEHRIAKVVQTIKSNSSREWCRMFGVMPPVWAGGYLARSVGEARLDAVQKYIELQPEHHGYAKLIDPPVSNYRADPLKVLASPRAVFELSHHLVFGTYYQKSVFHAQLGEELAMYWLRVAEKHNFAIDQLSIVPDHVHMIVRIMPTMSIEECALILMNNSQHFISTHHSKVMLHAGIDLLWQTSAYAGTCGDYTTGLIQHWLKSGE